MGCGGHYKHISGRGGTDNTTTGPSAATVCTLGCDSTGHQDTTLLLLCIPAGSLCACSQSSVSALQYLASVISHGDLGRAIHLQPATIPALCLGADHCGHKANVLVWRLVPWCQDSQARHIHSFRHITWLHSFGDLLVCEFCPLLVRFKILMQPELIELLKRKKIVLLIIGIGTLSIHSDVCPKPHKMLFVSASRYSFLHVDI